jgi:hypothetical protein
LSIPSEYIFLCARRKFGFNKKIRRNLLIPPAGYLGKYTANNDYTEEEVRRILREWRKVPPAHVQLAVNTLSVSHGSHGDGKPKDGEE